MGGSHVPVVSFGWSGGAAASRPPSATCFRNDFTASSPRSSRVMWVLSHRGLFGFSFTPPIAHSAIGAYPCSATLADSCSVTWHSVL